MRIWVDDLKSFARLCPAIDIALETQVVNGITICKWLEPVADARPSDVVVEAFGCELPLKFKIAMAAKTPAPVWINLEYLSAEKWVIGTHGLPSPQANLMKYFYFPGFVANTGGLLRERDLIAQRERFLADPHALAEFWRSLELGVAGANEIRVSLFCYDNPTLGSLLTQWACGSVRVLCLVPEGVGASALEKFFVLSSFSVGRDYRVDNLTVRIIPFVEQERYDRLLWACDLNFVRGEDSFVRAQWAGRPLVWHIYPQNDHAHLVKLDAFLDLYCADLETDIARRIRSFWHGWNGDGFALTAWQDLLETRAGTANHARHWAQTLAGQTDLASGLVNFSRDLLKLRVF